MKQNDPRSTRPFHKRIALVFDFDMTLSPGTVDALLQALGLEESDDRVALRAMAMEE